MKDKGCGMRSRSLLLTWSVDLLVSEVMNVPAMIEYIKTQNADIAVPLKVKLAVIQHFETQHLTPQKAGKIAAEAAVLRLVFTLPDIRGPDRRSRRSKEKLSWPTIRTDFEL